MNTLKAIFSCSGLIFSLTLSAQKKDSPADLPYSNKIEVSTVGLESLFQIHDVVSLDLAPGFRVEGRLANKSVHGNTVTSVLIKLDSLPGGILCLSRFQDNKGIICYSGHILKLHNPSGLMLIEKDQHYYFIETKQSFLVAE